MLSDVLRIRLRAAIYVIVTTAVVAVSLPTSALEPVSFPDPGDVAAFDVVGDDGKATVTVGELEELGLYRVATASPWEEGELIFEGVLFSAVIDHLGLGEADAVRLRGLDGYTQLIPREDWIDKPLILATRQDGVLLTRRTQGPTRLVYPLSEYPDYNPAVHDGRWVWLIETMEPVE